MQRTRRGFCRGGRAWRDRSNCIQLAKRAGASVVIGVDPIALVVILLVVTVRISALIPLALRRQRDQNADRQAGCRCDYRNSGYADALQSALRGLAYGGTTPMSRLPNHLLKVLTSDAKRFQ